MQTYENCYLRVRFLTFFQYLFKYLKDFCFPSIAKYINMQAIYSVTQRPKSVFSLSVVISCVAADPDTLFFSPQPEDVTAMEGSNATLKCGASKKQNVTFYWTQDGDRIENDTRRYMIGSDLYINRVSPLFDLGEFKCIATNATSGRSIVSRGAQINILCKYCDSHFYFNFKNI